MTSSPHSRFRLSHWGWFLLATVILLGAEIGLSIRQAHLREQEIIQRIQRWGGKSYAETVGPEWLRRIVGDDPDALTICQRVRGVDLGRTEITDAEINYLNGLNNLQILRLHGTTVTDAGLAHLKDFTNLHSLNLEGTSITDAGLAHLHGLTTLRFVFLHGTSVTEKGIKELKTALPSCVAYHD